ncbi:hypothetical protein ALC62_11071 [Cyphomyrmex costatus]|uniref:Uncharacterized protein n=1 Tax=Cyphomyrmex costatus TaxID=456900 RepID=A0A151ICU2_9HYME|nr:hypothetical protein ALC62_11071 [Cyphomyrmex costatus]
MDTERERERERHRQGDWRSANCFKPERGACPTFISTTKSNLPVSQAQLQ